MSMFSQKYGEPLEMTGRMTLGQRDDQYDAGQGYLEAKPVYTYL